MVKRYPYELWVQVSGETTRNADGDWLPAGETWVKHAMCRDEANNQGQSITLEDGTAQVYNTLVYLPLSCPVLVEGTPVEVRNTNGQKRQSGTIKRFLPQQLHCQLWF